MSKSEEVEAEITKMPDTVRAFMRIYPKHMTQSEYALKTILDQQAVILTNQATLLQALRLPQTTP
jgi:hypothetical protein